MPTMPRTTSHRFGDVVLVPFPFTDQSGDKSVALAAATMFPTVVPIPRLSTSCCKSGPTR